MGKAGERINCPHCQGSIKAPPLPAGSLCTCPKCGQSFPLGGSTSPGKPNRVEQVRPVEPPPQPVPTVAETLVRAELAGSRPTAKPAAVPLPPSPLVAVAPDDVIGQMLQSLPGGPAAAPDAAASAKSPTTEQQADARLSPARTADALADAEQENRLQSLLNAPAAQTRPKREDHLATATTQPAHQQTPPPPKPIAPSRPKAPQIPVVCKLCGTRMYVKEEQVGSRVRCPDCHSTNAVVLPATVAPKPQPEATSDQDDFVLSTPAPRPAYRPTVEPRGDYAALKYLDSSAPVPARRTEHDQPRPTSTDVVMTVSGTRTDDEEAGGEIALSDPVERLDIKQVVPLPPPDDPDEDNQFRGRFRDEEWGFLADPHQKDAWKKSPFYIGIVGFLFYPQTAYRVVLYSVLLSVDLAMFLAAIFYAQGESPLLFAALGFTVSSSVLSVLILGGSLPCLAAVAQDTANGHDAVETWPDWNIAEWLFNALAIPIAAFLAALPGSPIAAGCFSMGKEGILFAPFAILISELLFFPLIFGSMLAEGSLMPFSSAIWGSFQRRGDGWLVFYGASLLLGILLGGSMVLVEVGVQARTILVAPVSALLWVVPIVLYFRLLGRLLWYLQSYRRERDRPD